MIAQLPQGLRFERLQRTHPRKGFHCGHGAEGVSRATTEAVVLSCVLILVFNYFLGSVLP